jgi:hypothetical protein
MAAPAAETSRAWKTFCLWRKPLRINSNSKNRRGRLTIHFKLNIKLKFFIQISLCETKKICNLRTLRFLSAQRGAKRVCASGANPLCWGDKVRREIKRPRIFSFAPRGMMSKGVSVCLIIKCFCLLLDFISAERLTLYLSRLSLVTCECRRGKISR